MTTITDRVRNTAYPRLTLVVILGALTIVTAGVLAITKIGSPGLTFRIGVLGYLFFLVGAAGYISLTVANRLEHR